MNANTLPTPCRQCAADYARAVEQTGNVTAYADRWQLSRQTIHARTSGRRPICPEAWHAAAATASAHPSAEPVRTVCAACRSIRVPVSI
jgi:hypothetical protein